jgi:hypothetical protein
VFESQRGQLAGGDPTEGELSCPRSLANGTEPHLENPRKCFNGRVSGPRNLPLSNGAWASTRTTHYQLNEESAIRDPIDGGCGNLTLRPVEGRRGRVKNKSKSSPRSPRTGPGSGARRTATPPRSHRPWIVLVARASPKPAETPLMLVETCTTPTGQIPRKNPCRSTHASAGLRGLDPRVH